MKEALFSIRWAYLHRSIFKLCVLSELFSLQSRWSLKCPLPYLTTLPKECGVFSLFVLPIHCLAMSNQDTRMISVPVIYCPGCFQQLAVSEVLLKKVPSVMVKIELEQSTWTPLPDTSKPTCCCSWCCGYIHFFFLTGAWQCDRIPESCQAGYRHRVFWQGLHCAGFWGKHQVQKMVLLSWSYTCMARWIFTVSTI